MRIKLTRDLPVADGMNCKTGREFQVQSTKTKQNGDKIFYCKVGRMQVAVFHYECEVIAP